MTPRHARRLLEAWLDEVGWPWSRGLSLLLDECIRREAEA